MTWDSETISKVFTKTAGRCHLCKATLGFQAYGRHGTVGAWEVDHSIPQANGGTHHGNNLYPACTSCNRSKQDGSTRAARQSNGLTRAPMSEAEQVATREKNATRGAMLGGGIMLMIGAVAGAPAAPVLLAGAVVGGIYALLGHSINPES
jgi:hypothetical protein